MMISFIRLPFIVFVLLLVCLPSSQAQTLFPLSNDGAMEQVNMSVPGQRWYVNAQATGNHDGGSWTNAFTSIANALQAASAGDTILVAKGLYLPAPNALVLKDSVVVLGGFNNTGNPADADRNPGLYPTIISGETGNPTFVFDNLPNLVTGTNLQETTVLDGFILEDGFANNTLKGVALHLVNSKPIIRQCVFRRNSSYNSVQGGSGIFCNNSSPLIQQCFFTNNKDFGFSTFDCRNGSVPILQNVVFARNDGRTVVYANQSNFTAVNCTFFNNQIGVSPLPYGIRASYVYGENSAALNISNSIFYNNQFGSSTDSVDIVGVASAVSITHTITQVYTAGINLMTQVDPKFIDTALVAGADQLYFTTDDGLQLKSCSPAINAGINNNATPSFDLLNQTRPFGGSADLGAYEMQFIPTPTLLNNASDSLVATDEYTDWQGWTHYYNNCQLLLSVRKEGRNIGRVANGSLRVVVFNGPLYHTGIGTDWSQAGYVTPGLQWWGLNRQWRLQSSLPITDSLLVRLPFYNQELTDVQGSNTQLQNANQLVFFSVDPPADIESGSTLAAQFKPRYSGPGAASTSWRLNIIDTILNAEFYLKNWGRLGAGFGDGAFNGPQAANNNGCSSGIRILATNVAGSSYQWQIDTGTGYVDLIDDAIVNGSATSQLQLIQPPTSWYGYRFRCRVTVSGQPIATAYQILKFTAYWNGSSSTAWEDPDNWDCGTVPDAQTDVFVQGTFTNFPVITNNAVCRSIRLSNGAVLTLDPLYTLTITGQ